MITEEIIAKFFEGRCDAREAAIVEAWLNENPAKLKEYIGMEEWEDFRPAHALSPDVSGKLWSKINKNTASRSSHIPLLRWMAVAASVLVVAGLSWYIVFKTQKTGVTSAGSLAVTKNNNTPQKMMLMLSDGSTVELFPGSKLSYPEKFDSVKREVIINGEADFSIAKDAARPFYVHSNSLQITVLGTRFTVNSYEANNGAKVILHEGKVMVKLSQVQDNKTEYYLSPGDVFIVRKTNRRQDTSHTDAEPDATAKGLPTDSVSARILHLEKDKEDGYVFRNSTLDVVFDQLQFIYNTKIIYDKANLGNRTFIGKIDKKDSLSHILKSITLLNNFSLQKQGDSFIISN